MYDDYMENLLGENYSPYKYTYEPFLRNTYYNQSDNFYDQYNYACPYTCINTNSTSRNIVDDIENLYPEIYKIIYPMIQKACSQNTRPITEDVLDEMVNDIYNNIEAENIINLNIDVTNNRSEGKSLSNVKKSTQENREFRRTNNTLHDVVKILLIRELIGRPNINRPPRPFPPGPGPFPPFPPRPRPSENFPRPPRPRF